VTEELATLFSLLDDGWFLYGLGLAVAVLVVGLVSRLPAGWAGGAALLAGVGGATFVVGLFDPLPVLASIGLALITGILARPVIAEVSSVSVLFVISDSAWRPGLGWPVGFSSLLTTAAIWGPRRFGRADPRSVAVVIGGAAFGIWASVPDTEIARALLGATLALSLAAVVGQKPVFTGPAIGAFAGLATWATMVGGSPRVVSVFGAWCGLALMSVLGVNRFAKAPVTAWLAAQMVVVAAGSQIVNRLGSGVAAIGVSFIALAVAGAILAVSADRGIAPETTPNR
jgi:hypothetical protein